MACGTSWTVVQDGDTYAAFRNLCKCWTCSYCSKKRTRRLRWDAIRGEPNTFITLTVNPHLHGDAATRAQVMVEGWRKIVKWIREELNQPQFEYLAVIEETQSGEPHLHVVCRSRWVDQKRLSTKWCDYTGAFIVHITRIEQQHRVSRYISKYLSKGPAKFSGCKRYFRSKKWLKPTKLKKLPIDWSRSEQMRGAIDAALIIKLALSQGFTIERSSFDCVIGLKAMPP